MYRRVLGHPDTPIARLNEVFDRARHECRRAIDLIGARDAGGKGGAITRATEILNVLIEALDHSLAPDLCAGLSRVYVSAINQLSDANLRFDAAPVVSVEATLRSFQEAFNKAAAMNAAAAAPASSGSAENGR